MKIRVFVFIIFIVIFLGVSVSLGIYSKIDNITNIDNLVTITYSNDDINKLKHKIENKEIDFFEFNHLFKIQCLRKTNNGYYAVLLQEDGKRVFIFINKYLKLIDLLIVESFKSVDDFISYIKSNNKQKSIDEMVRFDGNTVLLPISAKSITAHIVKEGIVYIEYSCLKDGVLLEQQLIDKFELIDNDYIYENKDDLIVKSFPYIFPIDKI